MFPIGKTLASIRKAKLLGLMIGCALIAVVLVTLLVVGVTWTTDHLVNLEKGWLDTLVNWVAGILTGFGGWFMLPALTVIISSLFQETAIVRVEKAHYPDVVRGDNLNFWAELGHDIRFTTWAVFLNIVVLPLYFFGIGFVVSVLLNTYLLSREFFETAAGYHLGKDRARERIKDNKRAVYGGGFIITLMTLTPVLNLFVPILAVVWMVHVYHGSRPE